MKELHQLYHFLGSIKFAIILITLTAVFVIAGTILEAHTQSHLFSANFTYQHPVFIGLIWGFFINILISALRRYPFKWRHVPFLITHLGLLMLLSGVIIKSYWGIQGSMSIVEGGTSQRLFQPHTYALHIEKKSATPWGKNITLDFPFEKVLRQKVTFDGIHVQLAHYAQHAQERKQTWIKGNYAYMKGFNPIPIQAFIPSKPLIIQDRVCIHHENATPWSLLALTTHHIEQASKEAYLQGLMLKIKQRNQEESLTEIPLIKALEAPFEWQGNLLTCILNWNYLPTEGLSEPSLEIMHGSEKMRIALSGPDSLINQNISSPHRGKLPFVIDLIREPLLALIQDEHEDDHLLFFNPYGEIHTAVFNHDHLSSLIVYDEGFGGYTVHAPFPFLDIPSGRNEKEQAELHRLAVQLRQSLQQSSELSPPLKLLKQAAQSLHRDPVETILTFLQAWDHSSHLLYEEPYDAHMNSLAHAIDWSHVSQKERYACGWLCTLLEEMDAKLKQGATFIEILKMKGWPFIDSFISPEIQELDQQITLFAQQLFTAAAQLPPPPLMPESQPIKGLSAYLKAYGISLPSIRQPIETSSSLKNHFAAKLFHTLAKKAVDSSETDHTKPIIEIIPFLSENSQSFRDLQKAYSFFQKQTSHDRSINPTKENIIYALYITSPIEKEHLTESEILRLTTSLNAQEVILEAPLTLNQKAILASKKWENHLPLITLEFTRGNEKDSMTLTYDKQGTGLLWPIFKGEYIVRFQPLFLEIPYKIRLHDARQINYPGSNQPYSYESDLMITDLKNSTVVEKTISMNNVYETDKGYRFYLSNLTPPQEVTAQRIQLVVNYDPAKYLLTYPGAFIMCVGIVLLFWMKR